MDRRSEQPNYSITYDNTHNTHTHTQHVTYTSHTRQTSHTSDVTHTHTQITLTQAHKHDTHTLYATHVARMSILNTCNGGVAFVVL